MFCALSLSFYLSISLAHSSQWTLFHRLSRQSEGLSSPSFLLSGCLLFIWRSDERDTVLTFLPSCIFSGFTRPSSSPPASLIVAVPQTRADYLSSYSPLSVSLCWISANESKSIAPCTRGGGGVAILIIWDDWDALILLYPCLYLLKHVEVNRSDIPGSYPTFVQTWIQDDRVTPATFVCVYLTVRCESTRPVRHVHNSGFQRLPQKCLGWVISSPTIT